MTLICLGKHNECVSHRRIIRIRLASTLLAVPVGISHRLQDRNTGHSLIKIPFQLFEFNYLFKAKTSLLF
jgi:hypothetical protein